MTVDGYEIIKWLKGQLISNSKCLIESVTIKIIFKHFTNTQISHTEYMQIFLG